MIDLKGMTRRVATAMWRRSTLVAVATAAATIAASVVLLKFSDQVMRLGQFGYLGAFALAAVGNALVTVPFPWVFPVAAMGTVYSPYGIVAAAAAGAALGEIVPYLLGAGLARNSPASWLVTRLESLSPRKKTMVVLAMAFSPVLSYPGLAAGVLRYPTWLTLSIIAVAEGFKVWLYIKGVAFATRFLAV